MNTKKNIKPTTVKANALKDSKATRNISTNGRTFTLGYRVRASASGRVPSKVYDSFLKQIQLIEESRKFAEIVNKAMA
jgi:hypothetical protein